MTVKERTWNDYIRDARDELLRSGVECDPEMVVEYARTMPGGEEAEEKVVTELGHRQSRRLASAALREAESLIVEDENQLELFAGLEYRPPVAITKRNDEGNVVHKGVMHATRADGSAYEHILEKNIADAQRSLLSWKRFSRTIADWWHGDRTLADALEIRAGEK